MKAFFFNYRQWLEQFPKGAKYVIFSKRLRMGLLAMLACGMLSAIGRAQEVSESHILAARKAVAAIRATDRFDTFLSDLSIELKNDLMRKDPNLEEIISETVEEEAIKLAVRRGDLEKEAALVYAKHFSEDELIQISDFYTTPAGQKLLREGALALEETLAAFDIWRQGIAQDLSVNVAVALSNKLAPEATNVEITGEAAASENTPEN